MPHAQRRRTQCGCSARSPSGRRCWCCFGACSTGGGSKPTIKIGSDGFDEARVVAEVYAQVLEANGYTVDRAGIGLGARKVTAAALESGQIDMKPEYIGSGLVYYGGTPTNDPAKNAPTSRRS